MAGKTEHRRTHTVDEEIIRQERESFIHQVATYIVTLIVALPFYFLMLIFNRPQIYGKSNLTKADPPFLFISNHVSMLDDLFLGPILFLPKGLFHFKFIPYHTPERKNFYLGPIVSWVLDHTKCVPLTRGKGFFQPGMQRIIAKVILGGVVQIYPEGTRTRTGELGKGKAGVGRIIYETRCHAIPCYHKGLNEVLPIGKKIPRISKKVKFIIGEPVDFDEFFEEENNLKTWQKIADKCIEAIAELRDKLEAIATKTNKSEKGK